MKRTYSIAFAAALLLAPALAPAHGPNGGGRSRENGYLYQWQDPAHYPLYPRRQYVPAPHKHKPHKVHPKAAADPFYCGYCHISFRFRHKFYHHLQHDHRIAYDVIPHVVIRVGPTEVFID